MLQSRPNHLDEDETKNPNRPRRTSDTFSDEQKELTLTFREKSSLVAIVVGLHGPHHHCSDEHLSDHSESNSNIASPSMSVVVVLPLRITPKGRHVAERDNHTFQELSTRLGSWYVHPLNILWMGGVCGNSGCRRKNSLAENTDNPRILKNSLT